LAPTPIHAPPPPIARARGSVPPPRQPMPAPLPSVQVADGQATPHPRDVLDALALAGVFEPPTGATATAAWDRPDKTRSRKLGKILLSIATVLAVGGGIGAFYWTKERR